MRKKPNWACGACGKTFPRKWNALRHISRRHEGRAELMAYTQHLADLSSGKREIRNEMVPQSTIKTKGEHLVELIETHEASQLTNLMNSLLVLRELFQFKVQADVCKDCWSLAYEIGISQPENYSFVKHQCDLKWMFNYSSLFEKHKGAIIKHLESKVGINILSIMAFLFAPCQHAIIIQPEEDLDYFMSAKKDFELFRRLSKEENDVHLAENMIRHFDEREREHLQSLELRDTITTLDPKEFFKIKHLASQQQNAILQVDSIITALQILKRNEGIYRILFAEGQQYFNIRVI